MEYIGSGSTRKAYKIDDDTIIKIPINYGGLIQAENEIKFYNQYKNVLPLCPVLEGSTINDGIYQQYLEILPFNEACMFDEVLGELLELENPHKRTLYHKNFDYQDCNNIKRFIERLLSINFETVCHVLYDVCSYNVGLDENNDILIYDYGYPSNLRKPANYYEDLDMKIFKSNEGLGYKKHQYFVKLSNDKAISVGFDHSNPDDMYKIGDIEKYSGFVERIPVHATRDRLLNEIVSGRHNIGYIMAFLDGKIDEDEFIMDINIG